MLKVGTQMFPEHLEPISASNRRPEKHRHQIAFESHRGNQGGPIVALTSFLKLMPKHVAPL